MTTAVIDDLVRWLARDHGAPEVGARVRAKRTPPGRPSLWADGRAGTVVGLSSMTDFGTLEDPRVDIWLEVLVDDTAAAVDGQRWPQSFALEELEVL